MNKTKLIGGLIATLLLVGPLEVSADSDYPAYDFEPTIVYQDESVIAQSQAAESAPAPAAEESPAAEASGDDTLIFGVLILAGILFAAYKKSAGAPKKRAAGGATGVSRYLEQHAGASQSSTATVSGVEKYLQERG
jgi:hypothetical protein